MGMWVEDVQEQGRPASLTGSSGKSPTDRLSQKSPTELNSKQFF